MTALDRGAFLGAALAAAGTGAAVAQTETLGAPHPPFVAENDPAIRIVRPRLPRPGGSIGSYAVLPATVVPATPGIVMSLHIWGIDAEYRDLARRFAKAGYIAIVPGLFDRLSPPDGDAPVDIAPFAEIAKRMYAAGTQNGDLLAARAWIKTQAAAAKIGIYGNCMGGGMALQALVGNTNFAAASVLYGYVRADRSTTQPPPPDAFSWAPQVTAAVIGSYGGADTSIAVADVETAFSRIAGPHDVKIYAGAPHAFLDDTRPSYRPAAAADAWARQMAWFATYLPGP